MAKELPSEKFSPTKMFETASEASQKGFMKVQEANTRITQEMLEDVYLAGYRQCMKDYDLKPGEIPLLKQGEHA